MVKIKTKQFLSGGKPKSEHYEIGLLIKCLDCKKGRMFKITDNLKLIYKDRMEDKFRIETECEGCNRKIEVGLGWIDFKKGYSYKDFEKSKEISVEDENGLIGMIK